MMAILNTNIVRIALSMLCGSFRGFERPPIHPGSLFVKYLDVWHSDGFHKYVITIFELWWK
jgi:hypothetical protein